MNTSVKKVLSEIETAEYKNIDGHRLTAVMQIMPRNALKLGLAVGGFGSFNKLAVCL